MVALLGAKGTTDAQQYLQRVGAGESINFKFGGPIGNSRPSHLLLHLAKSKSAEIQTRVAEQLFRAHFEDEKDITATEVLVEAGVEAGLERNEIVAWLEGNQLTAVEEEEREVKGRGIKGVPQFVIAGKKRFEGASDVMDLFEAFIEYKEGKE
jgi:predicted DsbA family dithiol-disulfide isomerase